MSFAPGWIAACLTPEHFSRCSGLRPTLYYLSLRLGVDRPVHWSNRYAADAGLAGWGVSLLHSRVQVRTRGDRSDRAVCYLLHDPFDGVGTLTALRAGAEAVVI